MELKKLLKFTLLFSACFVAVTLLLIRAVAVGFLSPRSLGIVLSIFLISSAAAFLRIVAKMRTTTQPKNLEANRKQCLTQIRIAKLAIAILVLLLLNSLFQLRHGPLLPLSVGVAINVLVTVTLVRIVLRLKKSLNVGEESS
jgi:hypothetical protein